ncbi:cytochrome P450 [Nonomuraea sp. NPDC050643]|uniref:cytochrome P450 n=1 Tax=Nonomuraea sp. NPDC050643 TaxID=3155660 RepID=UPI0033F3BF62
MPTITRPPQVTAAQTLALATTLVLPALAEGAVIRRPLMTRLAALAGAERRAIGLLSRLRAEHGDGPLLVPVTGRRWAMVPLSSHDVRAVLADRDFSPATKEKRGALGHFEPDAVLITPDPELRERRRALNERVLCSEAARFTDEEATGPSAATGEEAGRFARVVAEEVATLPREGVLTWPLFHEAHWRIVRRIVLGDGARHDVTLTRQLDRLRRDANWSYLRGQRTDVRNAFRRRLAGHLARAEPGSLAAVLARTPAPADVNAEGQVPHWLFAYDAAAIGAYRALALLAAHPGPLEREHLRAAMLESLRLWPTTLAILREATGPTRWNLPEGTTAIIYSPYVNRAEPGDAYRPELWLGGGEGWAGVPFSAGFGRCAGQDLVLDTAATLLGAFLRERSVRPSVRLEDPVPASLDHFRLRFAVKAAER